MADSSYHDACIFDYCMGTDVQAMTEWVETHAPPENKACHVVADPRINTFNEYKFDFYGEGAYDILGKAAHGGVDPCAVGIQSYECPGVCPGPSCGRSYMTAVGLTVPGGKQYHEIIISPDGAKMNSKWLSSEVKGENIGQDGIKVTAYTPAKTDHNMDDPAPSGEEGWFIYGGGFSVNVTVTADETSTKMMNLLVRAPPMCTYKATGLCVESAEQADAQLQEFAEAYLLRMAEQKKRGLGHRFFKAATALLAPQTVPNITAYPNLEADKVLPGLKGFGCSKQASKHA
jgi:hypothetical protein